MRKSLLITLDFPPTKGGISNHFWNLCNYIPKNKITVLTNKSSHSPDTEFKIYRYNLISKAKYIWPKWLFLLFRLMLVVSKENNKIKEDKNLIKLIQVGQILPLGTVALIFKWLFGYPYMLYVYGQDLIISISNKRKLWLIKKILKDAESIISCSNDTKNIVIRFGVDKKKVFTVYPCIKKPVTIEFSEEKLIKIKNKYKLMNKKIILTVGNLVKRKGHDMVIKSLPKIINTIPNLLYVIIGSGFELKNLMELVEEKKLEKYVTFLNQVDNTELSMIYSICDAFIMASREIKNKKNQVIDIEGFGMVFIEANLYGKPTIGGNSGGVPEAIEDGISGILVDPEDTHDIADKTIKVLSNDAFANKLGEQGYRRAKNKFNCESKYNKILELLNE